MSEPPSDLVVVAALCQMLLEAIGRLDDQIASEAFVADLRAVCERAHSELERFVRRAADRGDSERP
jgi:hypothetical protein